MSFLFIPIFPFIPVSDFQVLDYAWLIRYFYKDQMNYTQKFLSQWDKLQAQAVNRSSLSLLGYGVSICNCLWSPIPVEMAEYFTWAPASPV